MAKLILIFLIMLSFNNVHSKDIYGKPKILDGDTIHIKTYKIRLEGIDAPEINQQCKKSFLKISSVIGFDIKRNYSCGIISKKKLTDKINSKNLRCISTSRDRYKRYLATCYKNKINLNKWMVRNGFAVAYKRYSKDYIRDEENARKNKLGIWNGTFTRPENWRKLN